MTNKNNCTKIRNSLLHGGSQRQTSTARAYSMMKGIAQDRVKKLRFHIVRIDLKQEQKLYFWRRLEAGKLLRVQATDDESNDKGDLETD